ncbi:hypothetical protein DVH24_015963 [Malus domestica]|uniref:Annexin n=1 Tax=Malus domestica TaxID=3750 RepID=A0A498JFI4_MALDO|nr:hypothetical protein DVH24_015963 [Malus domestica]
MILQKKKKKLLTKENVICFRSLKTKNCGFGLGLVLHSIDSYCWLAQLLVGLVSSYRYDRQLVDTGIADSEASRLHEAIETKQYDRAHVVWILSTRNFFQLRATFECYTNKIMDIPSTRVVDPVSLICIFSYLPNTRPFKSSLASDSYQNSEVKQVRVRAIPGWGPKRTISYYGGVEPFGSSLASDSVGTPKLRSSHESIPRISDPLGSSRMSSQK